MKKTLLTLIILSLSVPFLSLAADKPESTPMQLILNGKHRSQDNKNRDQYRHPQETLDFFDIKPDMAVVEIWPGKGWYTEILAPYLRDQGKLYAAHFSPDNRDAYFRDNLQAYLDKLHKRPDLYDKVEVTALQPPKYVQIAPDNSVDRIVTFRNVHNWMQKNQASSVFSAMYKALKPGGILGIVEHRGASLKPQDPRATSGYVSENYIIELARNAGFEFLAKSEINANLKDTKNYPDGVWSLPPVLKLKNVDRAKYMAIGESDRMTIKFIKPQPASLASFLTKSLSLSSEQANAVDLPKVIHNIK